MRTRLNPAGDIPLGCPNDHPPKHRWDRIVYNDFIFGGNDSPPPAAPNYAPMAAASDRAAELGTQLGREQLAEAQRQYDINRAVAEPVVKAQLGLMASQQQQGDDYYKYMTDTYRPLERGMVSQATAEGSDARMEEMAAQAAADARRGQTQQSNMIARQGLRYGYSPSKMATMQAQLAGANSSAVAGAMTGARNQQRNLGWARQLDAAGLGRNLPGASQGAYGTMLNSGNSAVSNVMQPGNALMMGAAQGAGMQQQGIGQQMTGLGGILSAQGSYNNMLAQRDANSGGGMGAMLGAAGQIGAAYAGSPTGSAAIGSMFRSDRRLKEDIVKVGFDERTGLNLYEFKYIGQDSARYRGVMADEVEKQYPRAVEYTPTGFAKVNYGMLGLEMVEV